MPHYESLALEAFYLLVRETPCVKHDARPGEDCYTIPPTTLASHYTGHGFCGARIASAKGGVN